MYPDAASGNRTAAETTSNAIRNLRLGNFAVRFDGLLTNRRAIKRARSCLAWAAGDLPFAP